MMFDPDREVMMFGQGDLPRFGAAMVALGVELVFSVVLVAYWLVRLAGWICRHVSIV